MPDVAECGKLAEALMWGLVTLGGGASATAFFLFMQLKEARREHLTDLQTALAEARKVV